MDMEKLYSEMEDPTPPCIEKMKWGDLPEISWRNSYSKALHYCI
jgi:hypothetical protein